MWVQLQVSISQCRSALSEPASNQGPHPGSEFRQRERLREIVICSSVKTFNALFHQSSSRQHQNGCLNSEFSEFPADLNATETRKTDIEQNGIVHLLCCELQGLLPVLRYVNRISVLAKGARNEACDSFLILDK